MRESAPDQPAAQISRRPDPIKRTSLASAALAVTIGMLGLLGWRFRMEVFKQISPPLVVMSPIVAVCIILSGAGIALSLSSRRRLAFAIAIAISTIALAKIVDQFTGVLPIDRILFPSHLNFDVGHYPSTLAPSAAAAMQLSGLSLAFAQSDRPKVRLISQLLAIWLLLMAMLVLVGYCFDFDPATRPQHQNANGASHSVWHDHGRDWPPVTHSRNRVDVDAAR